MSHSAKPASAMAIVATILGLVAIAACGPSQAAPQPTIAPPAGYVATGIYQRQPPYTFCFSNASVSNSWRLTMAEHVRYAVRHQPAIATYHETNANDDPAQQVSDIEGLLSQACDVLLVSPAKLEELKPPIDQAMAQGIPVVLIDRTVLGDNYVSYVTADNCAIGRLQAEWLAAELDGEGKIVLLSGVKGSSVAEDRIRCAREVFAQYPGITELAQGYANWSPVDGKKIMVDWLATFEQIDGIWADGSQGVGAVNAYLEAQRPIPPITGCDVNSFLKQWKQHGFAAMAATYPARVGQLGVATALDILAGKPVPHRVEIPLKVITQANLDQFVRMDLPDGYWGDSDPEVVKLMFPQ